MRVLLDTHVYLWCVKDDSHLSKHAREIILSASQVFVSSVSIWEIAIKVKLGKLKENIDELVSLISPSGFEELPLTVNHAAEVGRLAEYHLDPFDRALIAQALCEPLILLTADEQLKKYSDLVRLI